MFYITTEHKSSCDNFFSIYCTNITNFLFWVLWTCLATSIKNDNANLYKLSCLSACKKWTLSLTSFLRYRKDIANLWTCRKLSCLSPSKKINFVSKFFWGYCKDTQPFYFSYFGHAWLCTPKMIVTTCRKLRCLSTCKKIKFIIHFFLEILHLKKPATWLADSILAHNLRTRILPDMGLVVKYQ